ncbi:Putative odorant receptor 13a [Dufourea novaeangliae]|uniref:Odorant receptor n=1 Tax=Dufourea novaeangliae TaxID=178035 RepID=A0A154PQL1_DUFNO|nr:Putative odorant receptor 13a [Dufourea novaeangliae]
MQTKRHSDISIGSCAFFMKIIGLWTAENEREQLYRNIALVYTHVANVFGACVLFRDLYFCRSDSNMALYAVCNILNKLIVSIKLIVLTAHRGEFLDLLTYMQKHFWNGNYDHHEKTIIATSLKNCILFTTIVTAISHITLVCFLITPIIENKGKNESDRMLPFNMWLVNLPLSITPYYEMMFTFQGLLLYYTAICYFCFDNVLCVMSQHVCGQFRVLQYRFTKLYDSEETIKNQNENYAAKSYVQFRKCVRQHQELLNYCWRLENVFPVIVLGQVVIFSVLICLYGYQAFLAQSTIARRIIYIWFLVGSASLLFMFTYSCHELAVESENIGDAVYSAPWTLVPMNKDGKMLRDNLKLTIFRSSKACCFTAYGFFPVYVETFTTVINLNLLYSVFSYILGVQISSVRFFVVKNAFISRTK